MPSSLFSPEVQRTLDAVTGADAAGPAQVSFPSPADWRDHWIYFLLVDRFNNPQKAPLHSPFDDPTCFKYQGGKFSGIRAQLPYLKSLGAGALWLSPVLKNTSFDQGSYHGYGIQDFLSANPFFANDPAKADEELRELVDAAHAAGLYVIFDIVLNHAGDVFAYASNPNGNDAPYSDVRLDVDWRDATGQALPDVTEPSKLQNINPDALVWPVELQDNEFFRRQGNPAPYDDTVGDFVPFKQLATWETAVANTLIRAYQYVIARFDVDAFRIDTLRYLKGDLAQVFGNSMREFALSIGKKNFFTFGEVLDGNEEADIARFIGRNTNDGGDLVGVDAALDFPLFDVLVPVVKGLGSPQSLVSMYQRRKDVERNILSSHGDATRFFVTFLDNHDKKARIRYPPPDKATTYDGQVTAGLACLFTLPRIPCVYYGTEQGLHGAGKDDPAVREALWGGPGFDQSNPFYQAIQQIAAVRKQQAPLRYGRFYFRPTSTDKRNFAISSTAPGVLAFSRILNDQEVLTVANFSTTESQTFWVILDSVLSAAGDTLAILYSNQTSPKQPSTVRQLGPHEVLIAEVDGSQSNGPVNVVQLMLAPMEAQILRKRRDH